MYKSIAVLGAGAIGSSLAADFSRAGYDPLVIDQWPAHVDAMKTNGLHVTMPEGAWTVPVRACHICDVSTLDPELDVVFLCAKSYDTRWMTELVAPCLKSDGVIVGVQNGLNNDAIASIVGITRVIGCAFELSAEVFTPGRLQRNSDHKKAWFGIGELTGRVTPRLREIESIMSCVGTIAVTTNIHGAKWAKLVNSSMILAPFGVLGLQSYQAIEIPEVVRLCIRLGRESMAVGAALGYTIDPIFGLTAEEFMGSTDEIVEKLLVTIIRHHGAAAKQVRGVVLQDFLKGRRAETEYLSGLIVAKGKEARVPTPANAAITEVSRRIRRGVLQPGRSNLALIEELADRS